MYHHYISKLAAWYDLSDSDRNFAKRVPQEALSQPLLFNAVIAFAAIHLSRTTSPSLRLLHVAERHHSRCVDLLIGLSDEHVRLSDGIALAAVCLLRSYEILAEETDPNRHLSGAYALAASQPVSFGMHGLARAGFFNYLREDITFSLMNRQPLKTDLSGVRTAYTAVTDEDNLNAAALHLAQIINTALGGKMTGELNVTLGQQLEAWHTTLPDHSQPYCHTSTSPSDCAFPSIWMLGDCHVATAQYHLVAKSILAAYGGDDTTQGELHDLAARICGLAFTSLSTAVLVNSIGPISFCCRYLSTTALRMELRRRLRACEKEIGWPVQRITTELLQNWDCANPECTRIQHAHVLSA